MTERPPIPLPEPGLTPARRRRIALILSLAAPGCGHLWVGAWGHAVLAQAGFLAILATGCAVTFATRGGLAATTASALAWIVAVALHARQAADKRAGRVHWGPALLALVPLNLLVEPGLVTRTAPMGRFLIQRVETSAMSPTLLPDERIVVDKRWYRGRPVLHHDLVVMPPPGQGQGPWVLRCVARAGDEVEVRSGVCMVNGVLASRLDSSPPGGDMGEGVWVMTEGELFCLGDNHAASFDSRHFGPVREDSVRGRPLYVLASPDANRLGMAL